MATWVKLCCNTFFAEFWPALSFIFCLRSSFYFQILANAPKIGRLWWLIGDNQYTLFKCLLTCSSYTSWGIFELMMKSRLASQFYTFFLSLLSILGEGNTFTLKNCDHSWQFLMRRRKVVIQMFFWKVAFVKFHKLQNLENSQQNLLQNTHVENVLQ